MAIELMREVENQGFMGNFWRLNSLRLERGKTLSQTMLIGKFDQYKSSDDYNNDKNKTGVSVIAQIVGTITLSNTIEELFNAIYNKVKSEGGELEGGVDV